MQMSLLGLKCVTPFQCIQINRNECHWCMYRFQKPHFFWFLFTFSVSMVLLLICFEFFSILHTPFDIFRETSKIPNISHVLFFVTISTCSKTICVTHMNICKWRNLRAIVYIYANPENKWYSTLRRCEGEKRHEYFHFIKQTFQGYSTEEIKFALSIWFGWSAVKNEWHALN